MIRNALKALPFAALRVLAIVSLAILTLAGCSSNDAEEEQVVEFVERPVGVLYNLAHEELERARYRRAAALFNEVERQHPYSQWATKAKLMSAYAHYRGLRYDQAINALDRFIELHPGNEDIAYAYYLKSICYYEQISDVRRDQEMTQRALDGLSEVTRRFPSSPYARDAQLKLDLTRDHLAGKSMEVGRFYMSRRLYNAAINRFQLVVEQYGTTSHVPEALHRMVESYTALGLEEEARKTAAVLGYNFPESEWYEDSYRVVEKGGAGIGPDFFTRAWDSLF